jgi:hypothetical protein
MFAGPMLRGPTFPAGPSRMTTPGPSFRRHLEGWPVASWIVFVCALSAALVVPRKVEPELIPPPVIDRPEQRRELESEVRRAERARAGLPVEVRSVGEAFRRLGRAVWERRDSTPQLEAQLQRLAGVALERHGSEKLLELRALQSELFARAVRAHSGGEPALDLQELGGTLLQIGLPRGWLGDGPTSADDPELGTLFRSYWTEALGFGERHPYAPTLNEWRVYYRFLLSQPMPDVATREQDVARKLGYVAALAKHDQDYPARLARGILLYQRGAYAESAGQLRAHLDQHADGPWTLRARNYLAACGAALSE